jgi:pimeloyl-ACP methyl ester carboxylesterase
MFPFPWTELEGFTAHDWPACRGGIDLTEIAGTVAEACGIRDGDVVIGCSLGGMVACEISRIRCLKALVLVGSATHRDEVNPLLAVLRPLAGIAPLEWLRISAGKVPGELASMFAGVDSSFVRAMCRAVFGWQGLGTTGTRCIRIHGRRDLVIPPPANTDLLLDAGHLVSMTHPEECTLFVAGALGIPCRLRQPPAL